MNQPRVYMLSVFLKHHNLLVPASPTQLQWPPVYPSLLKWVNPSSGSPFFSTLCNLASLPTVGVVVQSLSCVQLFATPWTAARQVSLSFTISQSYSNSCPLSWWCYPTISSFVTCFSSCPQSFPASGSFPMSWLFASGDQSIGTSCEYSGLISFRTDWLDLLAV